MKFFFFDDENINLFYILFFDDETDDEGKKLPAIQHQKIMMTLQVSLLVFFTPFMWSFVKFCTGGWPCNVLINFNGF